jgi:hypothetical protein
VPCGRLVYTAIILRKTGFFNSRKQLELLRRARQLQIFAILDVTGNRQAICGHDIAGSSGNGSVTRGLAYYHDSSIPEPAGSQQELAVPQVREKARCRSFSPS